MSEQAEQELGASLAPHVYIDPRPAECFAGAHAWARTHSPDVWYDVLRLLALPLFMVAFRARSIGSEQVPVRGPAIIAPNHFSAMDHFLAGIYVRRRVRFMAKSQLFHGSLGGLLSHLGAFPVRRGQHDEEAIDTALSILGAGGVIAIYPEGGRSRSAQMTQRARPGVGRLALASGAPVVPVAIAGTERLRNWKREGLPRVTIRYGRPLYFLTGDARSREAQQEVADAILAEVARLHEQLARR